LPLLRAAIIQRLEDINDYRPDAVAELILKEREQSGNIQLRARLRQAAKEKKADQTAKKWMKTLFNDREIWEGRRLPKIFSLVPKAVDLIPGIDADKAENLLKELVPALKGNYIFWQSLRRPIYFRKHMRYLWTLFE
jgi:hypothetical protein